MTPSRFFLSAATVLSSIAAAVPAMAAACPGGGSLTITASADSLTLSPVAATKFNFGEHIILTAAASGFSIASYAWTIDTPNIKDYSEDLGTEASPPLAATTTWNTTALAASDLTTASVGFYWVPTAAQVEPSNGPFSRNVSLTVAKNGGGNCTVMATYTVERNETDITRQAEDFYTSNHRAPTATIPGDGHVVDEHIFWHFNIDGNQANFPQWMHFLAWHGEFIRRFDQWRVEFGYNKVVPWYPGRPLPTGPQFDADAGLRLSPYVPGDNEIPTYYTLTGDTVNDPNISGTHTKLAQYATLDDLTSSFEFSYHGQVHCAIGWNPPNNSPEGFFETSGAHFGTMCFASSPKDPMFWRWHGFIDLMYRNYCALHAGACPSPSPADPSADPWMADNGSDNGTTPSPGTHWISPDVWNRRTQVTTDACVGPVDSYGDHVTSGGVVRDCGTSADHENPVTGVTNYLYGTLRNTRPDAPRVVYAEVGVYYALASTGLHYPTDFHQVTAQTPLFLTVFLEPGASTSIGPIPWTPPALPPANDHYCLYLRVLSVQATPPVETMNIDSDVANNNNLAWRNIKVVAPGDKSPPSFFIVRNIGKEAEPLALRFEVPEQLMKPAGTVHVTLDEALTRALREGKGTTEGLKPDGKGGFLLASPKGQINGLQLAPRAEGHVRVQLGPIKPTVQGDITIVQTSRSGVDGGVTIRLRGKR